MTTPTGDTPDKTETDESWEASEQRADADIAAGRVEHFPDAKSAIASLMPDTGDTPDIVEKAYAWVEMDAKDPYGGGYVGNIILALADLAVSLRSRLQEAEKVVEAARAYADFENEERRKNYTGISGAAPAARQRALLSVRLFSTLASYDSTLGGKTAETSPQKDSGANP